MGISNKTNFTDLKCKYESSYWLYFSSKDEMVGWYHWLDGHEFEQALWVGDGQGSLVCYNPGGHKESDMTEPLNWLNWYFS